MIVIVLTVLMIPRCKEHKSSVKITMCVGEKEIFSYFLVHVIEFEIIGRNLFFNA